MLNRLTLHCRYDINFWFILFKTTINNHSNKTIRIFTIGKVTYMLKKEHIEFILVNDFRQLSRPTLYEHYNQLFLTFMNDSINYITY